jgi:hypothetical protein
MSERNVLRKWRERKVKDAVPGRALDGDRWCRIEVEVRTKPDGTKTLSICGSAGRIVSPKVARAEALASWEDFFEGNPEELGAFAVQHGKRTPKTAARYVVQVDGPYHGLDVDSEEDGKVFLLESCGQIREELAEWFPEYAPYFKYHLNDMHAGCEHQDALGWGHGYDVALSKNSMTPGQYAALEAKAYAAAEAKREKEVAAREARMKTDKRYAFTVLQEAVGHHPTVDEYDAAFGGGFYVRPLTKRIREQMHDYLVAQVTNDMPTPAVDSVIFKDSIGAPCPECGYSYGSAWLSRPLPPEVLAWAERTAEVPA